MMRADRRKTLQLVMAAAIAPALCVGRASASTPDRLIAPPTTPMRYTRTVSRDLVDGSLFTVTRGFDVTFRQFDGGFMMHGTQVRAEVDAPEVLAEFARLEEARDESQMFPIALDPFGQILSSQIAQPPGQHLREAVAEALENLAHQPISADEREQLSRFVSAMQQAGQRVIAHLPTDVFAPATEMRRDEQSFALPGGTEGRVETIFASERDASTGLMRAANRDVVTHVADSSRITTEHWSLGPA